MTDPFAAPPPDGQPSGGLPIYGAPPTSGSPYGAPPAGSSPYEAPPAGGSPYGAPPAGGSPYGAPPAFGAPGYGQPSFGAAPDFGPTGAYGQPAGYGQQPGYPPYGQQPGGQWGPYGAGYPAQRGGTNGLAIASMVLGIVWLLWLGSILAVIFGFIARSQIKRTGQSGNGFATAGLILGFIGVATLILSIAFGSFHGHTYCTTTINGVTENC